MGDTNPGDVVQVRPDHKTNPAFAGAFLVVTKVYSWGVQGYVQSLGDRDNPGCLAYYRLKSGEFRPIGSAAWWVAD